MKQLVQSVRNGELRLVDAPTPQISPTEVLVRTTRSLVSAGTEKAVHQLASASLLQKAKARPDLVRQVLKKARTEGIGATVRTVRDRLDEDMPMGYSGAGVVVEVGSAVQGVRPGDRVATGGAGHAELQVVAGLLTVPVPEGVDDESAAFATVGAIALNGLRLADVGPGAKVAVIGLGLVGQLTVRLARAAGCQVAALDVRQWPVDRAREQAQLSTVDAGDTTASLLEWSRGRGADAVIVAAATKSSDPMRRAAELARDRGILVLVGDVGLELDRRPLYERELQLRVARSYGPGRYEQAYEDLGIDYPAGQVRWTEGRNLEAFLDLLAGGHLTVGDLVTHRFDFDRALEAYTLLEGDEPYLGVELVYTASPSPVPSRRATTGPIAAAGAGIGLIGAGAFARGVLLPGLQAAGFTRFVTVTSASGLSSASLVDKGTFSEAAPTAEAVIDHPDVGVVVIATPHATHAALVEQALEAGKHVFCEKPLALDEDELSAVITAWRRSGSALFVGLNRRFSPPVAALRDTLGHGGPLQIAYRVNAGPVASGHWYRDRRQGGRLLGEVCHFVDTCAAVVGAPVVSAYATGSGREEALLDPDVTLALRFADGSQAAITYASGGHAATSKERMEVLGRGHTALLNDFTRLEVDGRSIWSGPQDKGHRALLQRFHSAVNDGAGDAELTEAFLGSSAATIAAAGSLLTGAAVAPMPL
ncbi:MAG: bi-domain-containing oxidoreductase [Actinobacteria bacterium]|nr:bi-domain-containing oxidoreductase [Actinomycetota bacterium]